MAATPYFWWINGERAVVLLYVARIIYAAPISLLPESVSFSVLSLFALSLDVSADHDVNPFSQVFQTRPGVSSGILLGAVTLPGLMLSMSMQKSRGLSLSEIGVADLERLQLQYWATSASCISVLVLLHIILHRQDNSIQSIGSCSDWKVKLRLSCIALYAGVCCITFSARSYYGWQMAVMLFWVVFHGLASAKLIQNILQIFPACASLGEALLVTSGLVIYFGDMLARTAAKIFGYLASSRFLSLQYDTKTSEISIIIQGMTLGLLLFPMFFKLLVQVSGYLKFVDISRERANHEMKISFMFYVSLAFVLIGVVPTWMEFVQDFHMHPLLWYYCLNLFST